ncbi:hypothetical protein DV735_g1896, partial [Chaetothyriales sp. CBS 134920]
MSPLTPSRDGSRDRSESRLVKHQHSFSESGRSSVPISDPDRAPPPLPLNPSLGSPVTRSNTSARIEEAAALIQARARENAPSSYTSNPPPGSSSPERSPVKAQHRRMQTLQGNGPTLRLSDSLERRSLDKGLRPSRLADFDDFKNSRPDRHSMLSEADSPSPMSRNLKQSENAPPATNSNLLALQPIHNRQESVPPLTSITNGSTGSVSTSHTIESLASQILNITSIATHLQREMASLSQRSKDNATDLMDLRKATNNRDEDIRKSLRDLVAGLEKRSEPQHRLLGAPPESRKSTSSIGTYLEDSCHETPRKGFTISRITSPSFEREISESPSLAYADGAASIALLEKVLREMATKEGQASIRETLEAVRAQVLAKNQVSISPSKAQATTAVDPVMLAKLEEILEFMHQLQDEAATKAIVRREDGTSRSVSGTDIFLDHEPSGLLNTSSPRSTPSAGTELGTEEQTKLLNNIKQAVAQGGGLTNEVKALVRELRGEVLGMGRDIAKRLEDAQASASSANEAEQPLSREEISAIVGDALAELKEQMQHILGKAQLQSATPSHPHVDTGAVVQAVTIAITNMPALQSEGSRNAANEREELIRAVREAWEDCKPEIALEHFGLERDEILETVKEGLKAHKPSQPPVQNTGATYEEVVDAVRKGLADFNPVPVEKQEKQDEITKEEILEAVREVLANFDWPAPSTLSSNTATESELSGMSRRDISDIVEEAVVKHSAVPAPAPIADLTRREIIDAVEEGMARQPPVTKEVEFNREDLFDAIKSCLEGEQNPLGGMGERVVEAMHEFLGSMKTEFQEYSTANGKDTEQVLDALKDGLEDLRADIEAYVDRAADVTGKDEIMDLVKAGFAGVQMDIEKLAARPPPSASNTPELLDAMDKEFQHLRDTINKSMSMNLPRSGNEEILDAIRDMQDDRQSSVSSNTEDVIKLVKEELEHLRATLAGTLVKAGASIQREDITDAVREAMETSRSVPRDGTESILSNTSELLDAFQDGVENIRADLQKLMNRPTDVSTTYEVLDTLKAGIVDLRNDISNLQKSYTDPDPSSVGDRAVVVHDENKIHTELESLKVMITQLRIKIEALDTMPTPIVEFPREMRVHKDDLDELHDAIQAVHSTVMDVKNAPPPPPPPAPEVILPSNLASKEDTDAIETLLTNMKAKIDDMTAPDVASSGKTEQIEAMEDMLRELRVAVEDLGEKSLESGKADLEFVEFMLKDVQKAVEEIQGRMAAISPQGELLSKAEIGVVESLCADIKTRLDDLRVPDPATLPTHDDIKDIRDSLKAFREQAEADNDLTAQAFEARKIEHGGLANKIDDVKGVIGDLRDELMNKLDGSEEGLIELNKVLGMHHDGMSAYATATSITELSDFVKSEFQKQADNHSSRKVDLDEQSATLFNKHEEVCAELKAAIEDKFNELMIKYDDAQASNASKMSSMDESAKSHEQTMEHTRAAVDEMKLVMETLGATMTEVCDGMSADSKTVFSKVDEASTKLDELQTVFALEQSQTREEVVKAGATTSRLEAILAENHPAVLAAIREVLDAVSDHKAHSQEQTENLARETENLARAAEEIKSGVGAIPTSITGLLPAPGPAQETIREVPTAPAYDDSEIHDKLDNLISHAATATEVFADIENQQKHTQEALGNLDKLDQIHGAVVAAAAEVASLVATQTRLMTEEDESKREEAVEAAIALEKRMAQKENVEADIVRLSEEKNALVESMQALRLEHEALSNQTKNLTRQVAQLETTLSERQKDMRDMNDRAESLERRIMEGIMTQARAAREAKAPNRRKKVSAQERDASMNLKRVPSSASTATATTTRASAREGNSSLAPLKKRPSLGHSKSGGSARQSGIDRRILSTSHVMGNRGRETPDKQLVLAPAPTSNGLVSLKRSHSVKSNPSSFVDVRKPSWNKPVKGGQRSVREEKENMGHDEDRDYASSDDGDEQMTERRSSVSRTSLGTSYMYTDSLGYDTGSSLSAHSARTVSYNSSIGGTLNGGPQMADDAAARDMMSLAHHDSQKTVIPVAQLDGTAERDHTPDSAYSDAGDDQPAPQSPQFYADEDNMSDMEHSQFVAPTKYKKPSKHNLHGSDSGLGTESMTETEDYHGSSNGGAARSYFDRRESGMARTMPFLSKQHWSLVVFLLAAILALVSLALPMISWVKIAKLSLPMPAWLPGLNILSTGITCLVSFALTRRPYLVERKILPLPPTSTILATNLSTLAATAIFVLSLIYAAGAGGADDLGSCASAAQWQRLFATKNEAAVRAIQTALQCCGYNSMRDRAWPFASKGVDVRTCELTQGYHRACGQPWRRELQLAATLNAVAALANWVLVDAIRPYADAVELSTLPSHFHEVLFAYLFYQTTEVFVSPWLSARLFPKVYPALSPRTRINWDVHVVSLFQSCLINALALWVIFVDKERAEMKNSNVERVYGYTGACGLIQALACGYFIWDLIVSTRHIKIFGIGIWFHAISALFVFSFGFRPLVNYYAPVFILYELSTPFLNVHWFCDKLNLTGGKLQWYNGITLLVTFFCSRLLWGTFQSFSLFSDVWNVMQATKPGLRDLLSLFVPRNAEFCLTDRTCFEAQAEVFKYAAVAISRPAPAWMALTYLASNMILHVLNFYWFSRMIETVRKRFEGKEHDEFKHEREDRVSAVEELTNGLDGDAISGLKTAVHAATSESENKAAGLTKRR